MSGEEGKEPVKEHCKERAAEKAAWSNAWVLLSLDRRNYTRGQPAMAGVTENRFLNSGVPCFKLLSSGRLRESQQTLWDIPSPKDTCALRRKPQSV